MKQIKFKKKLFYSINVIRNYELNFTLKSSSFYIDMYIYLRFTRVSHEGITSLSKSFKELINLKDLTINLG
jgi:hypothetical protein